MDSHACDACGGSGAPKPCECRRRRCYVPHDECDCGCPKGISGGHACPVCLGEGRISDRMPAKDALADAETLRHFCDENLYSDQFPVFSSYPLIAIWKCGNSGWTVRSINKGHTISAADRAEAQARAAFRAVPGLRGE